MQDIKKSCKKINKQKKIKKNKKKKINKKTCERSQNFSEEEEEEKNQ